MATKIIIRTESKRSSAGEMVADDTNPAGSNQNLQMAFKNKCRKLSHSCEPPKYAGALTAAEHYPFPAASPARAPE
jgi:hypothetical protein